MCCADDQVSQMRRANPLTVTQKNKRITLAKMVVIKHA
jgi:hypothetical protein